jgi:hypothetical protein
MAAVEWVSADATRYALSIIPNGIAFFRVKEFFTLDHRR